MHLILHRQSWNRTDLCCCLHSWLWRACWRWRDSRYSWPSKQYYGVRVLYYQRDSCWAKWQAGLYPLAIANNCCSWKARCLYERNSSLSSIRSSGTLEHGFRPVGSLFCWVLWCWFVSFYAVIPTVLVKFKDTRQLPELKSISPRFGWQPWWMKPTPWLFWGMTYEKGSADH